MKGRTPRWTALVLAVMAGASACAPPPPVPPPLDVAQAHAIFAAAIEFTGQYADHPPPFAIGTRTEPWDLENDQWHTPAPAMPGIGADWLASRAGLDAAPCAIDPAQLGDVAVQVVQFTVDEQPLLRSFGYFRSEDEQRAARGVHAAIQLSRPYVTPAGDRAVIYVCVHCGPLCGTGKYLALERTDAGWRVVDSFSRWCA